MKVGTAKEGLDSRCFVTGAFTETSKTRLGKGDWRQGKGPTMKTSSERQKASLLKLHFSQSLGRVFLAVFVSASGGSSRAAGVCRSKNYFFVLQSFAETKGHAAADGKAACETQPETTCQEHSQTRRSQSQKELVRPNVSAHWRRRFVVCVCEPSPRVGYPLIMRHTTKCRRNRDTLKSTALRDRRPTAKTNPDLQRHRNRRRSVVL